MSSQSLSDRELLVFAAKAAGFGAPDTGGTCWTGSEYPRNSGKHGALWNYVGHMDTAELWNPLSDDGDALRLAVKLKFAIHIDGNLTDIVHPDDSGTVEAHLGDPYAATRRAIVRAAAAIGENL